MRRLSVQNKNITIKGAGQGVTNITASDGFADWYSNGGTSFSWRLSGMSFSTPNDNPSHHPLWIWCSAPAVRAFRGAFRVDHIDFNYPKSGGLISVYGPCYGLIDHNYFTGSNEHAIWTGLQLDSECNNSTSCTMGPPASMYGQYMTSQPFLPGAANNGNYLYIEDNTFVGSDLTQVYSIKDTGYTGGRTVIRHNQVTNAMIYSHWNRGGSLNTEWLEVYNNKFVAPSGAVVPYWGRMQGGGTGVIFNNTAVGYGANGFMIGEPRGVGGGTTDAPLLSCDGTHPWDGNAGDATAPGWPCINQTGRGMGPTVDQLVAGAKQPSFPLYMWGNGTQDSCYNPSAGGPACDNSGVVLLADTTAAKYMRSIFYQGSGHTVTGGGFGQGDVDYSVTASQPAGAGTHTLVYTPYTYPHPRATQP
jgi:hypothetical protein